MRLSEDWEIAGEPLDAATLDGLFGASSSRPSKPAPASYPALSDDWEATGEVVDGDTIRLTNGSTGRLYGFDAFERGQQGYPRRGDPVDLGALSTGALSQYIRPSQPVTATGGQTWGRPVITLGEGADDPAINLLRQGAGYAAPEYLRDDPERAASYLEAERLGRLNRQGGFGVEHIRPDAYRRPLTTRTAKLAADEYLAYDDQLPDDAPKLKRLTTEQEGKIARYIASQAGNPNFSLQQYREWFRNELGVTDIEPSNNPAFIESVRKGEGFSPSVDYGTLDSESMRELQELIAFSGMRPEDAQGYRDLLKSADQAEVLEYARSKGMTLDPRDVSAYFDARANGESAPIPLPLIDPGDGRFGATARGFGDPLGFLDEMGGVVDTLGGTGARENIWNSDRSFGEIYDNNTRQNRAIIDHDETRYPFYRLGGQVVGGLAIPIGGGVRGAAGLAKAGAIEGGIYGFGSADGDLGDRLLNVPLNAAGGALTGAAFGKAIDVAEPVVRKGVGRLVDLLRETPDGPQLHPDFEIAGELSGDALANLVVPGAPVSRADMAAEPNASLSGPRIPDMIDVNAPRARPLSDGPTPAMMQAATARVEPQDVLPRASNELTPEEAASLGQGPYPAVPAPRERDYLEARQYPSARNPDATINRRGPADLVTFTRSLNGIRDEGGELTAAGISNAARKGEDFAGSENRLGRLVNNENGLSIEEAAQRAYDKGYFPELDRPPTRQEFIAALDDTYRGAGRRFLPEDEAEIQAFGGARDQRLAVERSRQVGAPLADDIGQPATLEDVIANTPPALDPDDWNPAALRQVGNVRVDKLDSPQEISRALKVSSDIAGGFESARRGRITQAETEALASDLGMTANDLLARRKGQAFNAEEALAARRILAASGNELVNMARRIQRLERPGDDLLAQFRKALVRHTAIQEQVSGATAEAGRALAQFRMAANSRDHQGRVLDALVGAGGGADRLKEAAEAIITLERDPGSLNSFVEKVAKPKWKDKAIELWYNFLLSGPQTHAVNVLSNTMTSLAQIPEHAAAAGIGKLRALTPHRKRNIEDRVSFTEVGARAVGLLQGTKEGMREMARAFRTGEPSDFVTKVEAQGQHAISGRKGELLRLPTRALTAEDELFKAMARRMELSGLAVRQARKEGLRGAEGRQRAAELLNNPTDEMWEKAMDYGRYATFQRPLGPHASKVSALTNGLPIAKVVLPFIRTPTNLFKFTVERSPAAPMLREWRKDFAAGGARRDIAIARALVGSGMGMLFAQAAANGQITGSAPRDENKRRLMMADGWQAYSVKIGDRYYSYQRLDPFALTIGAAADMATLGDGMTENQRAKGAALVWASILGNLSNKTWLSGVSDILAAIDDPERYGGNFIDRFAGSATVPTGIAQVARTIDPTMRETDGTLDYIQSRIPGLSSKLPAKLDVWGRPIEKEGGVGPDIVSPIWTSTAKADPATWEAVRLGAPINLPNEDKSLSAEQMHRWRQLSGTTAHKWVSRVIETPEYRETDDEGRKKIIAKTMELARAYTKENVLTGARIPGDEPARRPDRSRQSGSGESAPPSLGDMGDWELVQ